MFTHVPLFAAYELSFFHLNTLHHLK